MNCHLFVYGTLRYLEKNHHYLKQGTCIAEQAWTNGSLFDSNDGYPAMTVDQDTVYGELYEIDEDLLPEIHKLEGYLGPEANDSLFEFVPVRVYTDTMEHDAFCYVIKSDQAEGMKKIKSGDWKEHQFILNPPPETFYFAFGSCMDTERFQKAAVDQHFADVIGGGKAEKYSVKFTVTMEDGGRADLVEDGGCAEGILYRVPEEAVDYLYMREGVDSKTYRPAFIRVKIGGEVYEQCLTFTVIHKKEEFRPPSHYSTEILRGAEGRLGDEYVEKIRAYMNALPEYKP
ncbi:gamma-glutamylcyclotransferase [Metabacillus idriensis]|uniref:gamma-glutamylcyclotransferase n=1 Tax=Metabacillus idriensis TaxID=324768 RepID=UPI003D278374